MMDPLMLEDLYNSCSSGTVAPSFVMCAICGAQIHEINGKVLGSACDHLLSILIHSYDKRGA